MSNRRRPRRQVQPIAEGLRALDGARIPGGCDECDAYQTVDAPAGHPNVASVTVHHDEWCPWLARREER